MIISQIRYLHTLTAQHKLNIKSGQNEKLSREKVENASSLLNIVLSKFRQRRN